MRDKNLDLETSLSRPTFLFAFSAPRENQQPPPLLEDMLPYWTKGGIDVVPVGLDGTASDDVLVERYRSLVEENSGKGPLVLGGFSLGARIAALTAPTLAAAHRSGTSAEDAGKPTKTREATRATNVVALVGFGFPFHRRENADDTHGLRALEMVSQPALIVQGTRDPHGNEQQVRSYTSLPLSVRLHWLADGNHQLQPRERSGVATAEHLARAAQVTRGFIHDLLRTPRHD